MTTYRLKRSESVDSGVRRIACEQIDEALEHLTQMSAEDSRSAVHEARKNAKKFRGLVRLVRPALRDHYSVANEDVRERGAGAVVDSRCRGAAQHLRRPRRRPRRPGA